MSAQGPLIVVKRDEEEFAQWASTEIGFLTCFGRFDDEPIEFEPYQLSFLKNPAPFRCVEKARQVGFSWLFACEAMARSHLRDTHTAVFVSYNLADAKEKIAYCQRLHEELPLEFQKKKIVDSKLEIAFRSNSASARVSRIISNPSKAPRGKKGDIYLDELAHCANDREIYKGSTALILRAQGQLSVCSSPLGRRGIFWEIARQEIQPYRAYKRQRVPWWLCSFFCKDVARAAHEAPLMTTQQRLEVFGQSRIIEQADSLLLEDFQQEFEVVYSDETLTFYPYPLIMPCTDPELELATDFAELARCRGRLLAGFDVGRKRDFSELAVFEEVAATGRLECRMLRQYDRIPFKDQENDLRALLQTVRLSRLSIDNTGMGMNLVENLRSEFAEVVAEDFTTPNKETWCTDFKILLQRRAVLLPRDRQLIAQIHSIKKNVTGAGRVTFETEKDASTKGHADRFWAVALACQKDRMPTREMPPVRIRIFGEEKEVEAKLDEATGEYVAPPRERTTLERLFDVDEEDDDDVS